jgi:Tol biopolymer transport system component
LRQSVSSGLPRPDGIQLATQVEIGGLQSVWMLDRTSGGWRQVSPAAANATDPTWSPDGASLAMAASSDAGSSVLVFDGSQIRTVIESEGNIRSTDFSPTGGAIAYAASPVNSEQSSLNIVTLDGGYAATLSPEDSNLVDFDWVPEDGPTSMPSFRAFVALFPVADFPPKMRISMV